ncbi:MAG: hypothetical protein M1837_005415 [Sclerophora amabilis]|nr:MAG: hypothetical protein M1837_005415 [Sclerophora amabilis]
MTGREFGKRRRLESGRRACVLREPDLGHNELPRARHVQGERQSLIEEPEIRIGHESSTTETDQGSQDSVRDQRGTVDESRGDRDRLSSSASNSNHHRARTRVTSDASSGDARLRESVQQNDIQPLSRYEQYLRIVGLSTEAPEQEAVSSTSADRCHPAQEAAISESGAPAAEHLPSRTQQYSTPSSSCEEEQLSIRRLQCLSRSRAASESRDSYTWGSNAEVPHPRVFLDSQALHEVSCLEDYDPPTPIRLGELSTDTVSCHSDQPPLSARYFGHDFSRDSATPGSASIVAEDGQSSLRPGKAYDEEENFWNRWTKLSSLDSYESGNPSNPISEERNDLPADLSQRCLTSEARTGPTGRLNVDPLLRDTAEDLEFPWPGKDGSKEICSTKAQREQYEVGHQPGDAIDKHAPQRQRKTATDDDQAWMRFVFPAGFDESESEPASESAENTHLKRVNPEDQERSSVQAQYSPSPSPDKLLSSTSQRPMEYQSSSLPQPLSPSASFSLQPESTVAPLQPPLTDFHSSQAAQLPPSQVTIPTAELSTTNTTHRQKIIFTRPAPFIGRQARLHKGAKSQTMHVGRRTTRSTIARKGTPGIAPPQLLLRHKRRGEGNSYEDATATGNECEAEAEDEDEIEEVQDE